MQGPEHLARLPTGSQGLPMQGAHEPPIQGSHELAMQTPVQPRRSSRSAQLRYQAGALTRKCALQQRRSIKTNICLISAPLIVCAFLWVLQHTLTDLLLAQEQYNVG
jgi:hypothetical protein